MKIHFVNLPIVVLHRVYLHCSLNCTRARGPVQYIVAKQGGSEVEPRRQRVHIAIGRLSVDGGLQGCVMVVLTQIPAGVTSRGGACVDSISYLVAVLTVGAVRDRLAGRTSRHARPPESS